MQKAPLQQIALALLVTGLALALTSFGARFYGGVEDPRGEALFLGGLGLACLTLGILLDRFLARRFSKGIPRRGFHVMRKSRAEAPQLPADRLRDFCRRHRVQRLSLFGSALRDDFRDDSDIDVLVEFAPGQTPSLLDLGGMQVELSEMLGRTVDLKTPGFLSPSTLEQVRQTAEVQYAACL